MTQSPSPWQDLFVGRRRELAHLQAAWDLARAGEPQFVVLLAESGMGKTRLVQQFYSWLSQNHDAPDPGGYWADWLERDRNSLSVNPTLHQAEDLPSIPWLWWGLRFTNPTLRNRAEASSCGLVHALPVLTPHFVPLQRAKEARAKSVELGISSMTALIGVLGMATLGPVAGGVVAALGTLSALKEKVDLLRGAKRVLELKTRDDPSLAERALADKQDVVQRIGTYFKALLTKGADGKGGITIVLVVDDAQWMDADSLAFLDGLLREALVKGLPLMVVCTHWEREWHEAQVAADPAESLAAWARANPEAVPLDWAPLAVGKVDSSDLGAVLAAALPGLSEAQWTRILERVDGNPGYLFDLVTLLGTSKRKFFEGNDPTQALKPGAEQQLEVLTALNHYQLNLQRFGELDEDIKTLLAWSSYQGTRFVDALTLEVGHRIEAQGGYSADQLREAETPYAMIDVVSRMSHEFRQRTMHEIAAQELREIEDDFRTFRDALRDTLTEWLEADTFARFDGAEREQLLRLLVEALSGLEHSHRSRRTLGRALEALFLHYQENGQGRQAVEAACLLVEAMPDQGWPGETVSPATQSRVAAHLDSYLYFTAADQLWDRLLFNLEDAARAGGDLKHRAWLAAGHLLRGLGLSRASGTHLTLSSVPVEVGSAAQQRTLALDHLTRAIEGYAVEKPTPWVTRMLARALEARGRLLHQPLGNESGIADFERAIAVMESTPFDPGDADGAEALMELARYHTSLAAALGRREGGSIDGEIHYQTALAVLRGVQFSSVEADRETLSSALTTLHLQRGINAARLGEPETSLSELERGLDLSGWSLEELERWDPDDFVGFAGAQFHCSEALTALDRAPEAVSRLDAAIRAFETLRERSGNQWPLTWDSLLALLYDHRQVLLRQVGRGSEARADRMTVLGIREAHEELGDAWTPQRRDLVALASAAHFQERPGDAVEPLEELREVCGEKWPLACRARLSSAYTAWALDLMVSDEGVEAAHRAVAKAVELAEAAVTDSEFMTSTLPQTLIRAHDLSTTTLPDEGHEDARRRHVERALEIAQRVMQEVDLEGSPMLNDLARAHERMGRLHSKAEEWAEAGDLYSRAVALRERAARQETGPEGEGGPVPLGRWANFLAMAHFEVGRAEQKLGRQSAAESSFNATLELGRRLQESGLAQIGTIAWIAMAHAHLGLAEIGSVHDADRARAHCEAALEIWARLSEEETDPEHPDEFAAEIARAMALQGALEHGLDVRLLPVLQRYSGGEVSAYNAACDIQDLGLPGLDDPAAGDVVMWARRTFGIPTPSEEQAQAEADEILRRRSP